MTLKHTLVATFALVFSVAPASALTKEFSQTYPLSANGSFSLDNVNGDVTIVGWDRNEASVEATIESRTQAGLDRVEIKAQAQNDAVTVETKHTQGRGWFNSDGAEVTYQIKVPRGIELRSVELVNGSLRLEGVKGKVAAATVNGKIIAEGLEGSVKLETVNGSIKAGFETVGGDQKIQVESVNGPIRLTLPRNADADIEISTVHGAINNDFGLKVDDGDYVGHDLEGKIGNGSAQIRVENVNGSVDVDAGN